MFGYALILFSLVTTVVSTDFLHVFSEYRQYKILLHLSET